MKRNYVTTISILLVLIVLHGISSTGLPYSRAIENPTIEKKLSFNYAYQTHEPISIDGDIQLAQMANNGSGSSEDPFIINGWNITGYMTHAVDIENTNKHLVIQNCWIKNLGDTSPQVGFGIVINKCQQGTITLINNTLINLYSAIDVSNSRSSNVMQNNVFNSTIGLWIKDSGESIVTHNQISRGVDGIILSNSSSSLVEKNSCTNLTHGIGFYQSNNSTAISNPCTDMYDNAIILHESQFSAIINNTITGRWNGLYIVRSGRSRIINNSISNNHFGILSHDSSFLTIKENSFDGNQRGMIMHSSDSCVISDNIFTNNDWSSIALMSCMWCSLTKNSYIDSADKIILEDSFTMEQFGAILSFIGFIALIILLLFIYSKYLKNEVPKNSN